MTMAKMTERMKELFEKVGAVALGTSTVEGVPNVVPVDAVKIVDDETILISDQFLNKTLANMKSNPQATVTFWEGDEGYQLKGTITIETSGDLFEETSEWIKRMGDEIGFPLKSKGVVLFKIVGAYGVSPGPGAGKQIA